MPCGRGRGAGGLKDLNTLLKDGKKWGADFYIADAEVLRGALTVVVGIQPDVAFAMVSLGMSTDTLITALDLEEGLEYLDSRIPHRSVARFDGNAPRR